MLDRSHDPEPCAQVGALRTSGVTSEPESDGLQGLRIERVELRDLRLVTPFARVSAATAELSNVAARLRTAPHAAGALDRLAGPLTIGELRLTDARVELRVEPTRTGNRSPAGWRLEPLAALDGTVHADVADAAWVFDADVTLPISRGRLDFNRATVEHVGPDSSMGISRMGIYVDAPNGRHYLYLLSATQVPGATFERRATLLPFGSGDRGSIDLRPFVECLLAGLPLGSLASGTQQMIARTRLRAELQPGDGAIASDRDRVVLTGRERGKNRIELSSTPTGPGFVLRIPELSAAESQVERFGWVASTGALSATLSAQLGSVPAAPSLAVGIADLTVRDIACRHGSPQAG